MRYRGLPPAAPAETGCAKWLIRLHGGVAQMVRAAES